MHEQQYFPHCRSTRNPPRARPLCSAPMGSPKACVVSPSSGGCASRGTACAFRWHRRRRDERRQSSAEEVLGGPGGGLRNRSPAASRPAKDASGAGRCRQRPSAANRPGPLLLPPRSRPRCRSSREEPGVVAAGPLGVAAAALLLLGVVGAGLCLRRPLRRPGRPGTTVGRHRRLRPRAGRKSWPPLRARQEHQGRHLRNVTASAS